MMWAERRAEAMRWVSELPAPIPTFSTRSTLTKVVNEIVEIRRQHAEAFQYDSGYDGGEFSAGMHERAEDREIAAAISSNGWTRASLDQELRRRTTKRWAKEILMGWV